MSMSSGRNVIVYPYLAGPVGGGLQVRPGSGYIEIISSRQAR